MRPISVTRFERKLRAITGAAGSNLLADLDALVPLLVLESDRPEWKLAGGELPYGGFVEQVAVAGQNGWVALVNPTGTGLIAVVESARNRSPGPADIQRFNGTAIAGFVVGFQDPALSRDYRTRFFGTEQVSACRLDRGSNAVAIVAQQHDRLETGNTYDAPIIVAPGQAVILQATTVNSAARAAFAWREVPLEAGNLG